MNGPDWDSTAIFLSWDDWGGFYDHVVPPVVDANGYGLRDDFLGGQRLDPATDGRPDPRITVRENVTVLGDPAAEFDFTQAPRPPEPLPVHPRTTLTGSH